jgi:hypothetical protein
MGLNETETGFYKRQFWFFQPEPTHLVNTISNIKFGFGKNGTGNSFLPEIRQQYAGFQP